MKEIWKDIEGYEGLYKISNMGRVYSLYRNKILSPGIDTSGYKVVNLCKNRKQKTRTVHRLVAEAFIENPNNYPIINHKDENKENNIISNLEWCTCKYNINYSSKNGKAISERMKGNNNAKRRKVKCITTGEKFISISEAARKYNVHRTDISKVCKGKQKYCGKHPVTNEPLKW